MSIDEAYLDVTGSRRLFGPPRAIARRIQEQVYAEHGITCSIGIGPTKLLAKLAAGLHKPAGVGELSEADVGGRLRELPVGDLHGVGPVTAERLAALGLTTVGMLQDVPFASSRRRSGAAPTACASSPSGAASRRSRSRRPLPKSVGHEITFADDTNDLALLHATLLGLTDRAVSDLRRHGLAARTVTVKVRYSTFDTVERRRTLARPTAATPVVYRALAELLDEFDLGVRWVRLVGVSLGNLTHDAFQLTLDEGWREIALDEAVDRVREKYGFAVLGPRRRLPGAPVRLVAGRAARRHRGRLGARRDARPAVLDFTFRTDASDRPRLPWRARRRRRIEESPDE